MRTKVIFLCAGVLLGVLSTVCIVAYRRQTPVGSFLSQPTPMPTPLAKYSFENLFQTSFPPSPIVLGVISSETATSRIQKFQWSFSPRPGDEAKKTVAGVINIPKAPGTYPVLLMLRGYIPPASYKPGAGTQPSASVFVNHGYITIAPDFLGFGGSDARSDDAYEARFQTYTTALSLNSSLSTLNSALDASYSGAIRADIERVGLWGHSNGGHIALSLLAITGKPYPTVLWAPVSKSFPYSVLAYTDEDDDGGKAQRKDLARFEHLYDTDLFNPAVYYDRIVAPLSVYQGTRDEAVPYWWSDTLVKNLKADKISVEYHVYPGSDHNLRPAWNDVVNSNLDFYDKQFSK